jgi:hypothetical protein
MMLVFMCDVLYRLRVGHRLHGVRLYCSSKLAHDVTHDCEKKHYDG